MLPSLSRTHYTHANSGTLHACSLSLSLPLSVLCLFIYLFIYFSFELLLINILFFFSDLVKQNNSWLCLTDCWFFLSPDMPILKGNIPEIIENPVKGIAISGQYYWSSCKYLTNCVQTVIIKVKKSEVLPKLHPGTPGLSFHFYLKDTYLCSCCCTCKCPCVRVCKILTC